MIQWFAMRFQLTHNEDRCNRCRKASGANSGNDPPIDIAPGTVRRHTEDFGQRSENEIGTYCNIHRYLEEKHKSRSHQRTATDTSQTDNEADYQTDYRI